MSPSRLQIQIFTVVLLCSAVFFTFQRSSAIARIDGTRKTESVAAGIDHIEIHRGDQSQEEGRDRWFINVLVIDPRRARIELGRAMDEMVGAETTSSIALRHNALAAINGGYFLTTGTYRGTPQGIFMRGRTILSDPVRHRPGLAVSSSGGSIKTAIATVEVKTEIKIPLKPPQAINGVNRPRADNELILYTSEFHRTTLTTPNGVEVIIRRQRVIAVRDHIGSQRIPNDGCVLSATGNARLWVLQNLRPGKQVRILSHTQLTPSAPFKYDFIIGGGPQIVHNGQPFLTTEPGQYGADFLKRNPRTTFGTKSDGTLVLVTVDGRQPKKSVGMSIEELSALMIDLGCTEAINLDGGGSTTMVIKNHIVNSPSDAAGERPVSDALLIFAK